MSDGNAAAISFLWFRYFFFYSSYERGYHRGRYYGCPLWRKLPLPFHLPTPTSI